MTYISPEQIALNWMVEQIKDGGEFPDVLYKASKKFSFDEEGLKEAYDKLPTPAQIYKAFCIMDEQGGSFAHHLAKAWFVADSSNKARIESTWDDLIGRYL